MKKRHHEHIRQYANIYANVLVSVLPIAVGQNKNVHGKNTRRDSRAGDVEDSEATEISTS